ncbi:DNA gyrase/topoisomerase IV subunit A [Zunongwangia profunda]|uniref:DNA topoisomerase IV subunit A n=4 Tax=Zunongwangia profunda TaxID=398743 RepID=D5BFE8_ZUNPS|nr:DNA gyrase/topoisomerase IV subunit A [Zunongwangia profunda]ADF53046.1 DNA topoisomerase IV subunit A [Zunongwangia profunda SM-A87]MAC65510.1 DNA topoisomerase IV [Flavobacteriaceae bacterium]MAS72672.1 DNA topoisomerase IV [Zunongwangia sp.]HCV79740.1 DNA gyrase/topoisomerase IV subunit A [Zunongwangia profunda]|tara:strand:+ start:481 stop:3102 length:2622 start_codon:yes stop_codon:yes gene_type:complete
MEENPEESKDEQLNKPKEELMRVTGMYKDWFLDYASYVILERAVPAMEDGFKPVQRRIMHSMKDLDDGRYNKVANIVGHTMQYHPHGDASIGDAMVQIGQKDLLIDTQGNWGNILTGDRAAAPRYIEARLSKFALEVLYNPKLTEWQLSYDGRKKEPVNLPVKFPMLLAQGGEGIAVGLSTRLLPHNFNELIDASIKHLQGKRFKLFPDFPTGGIADISHYNDGKRGGRVRVRAKISQLDKNTLVITEIPFGTTTTSLIDSVLKANEKGKIKIKKIEDNTAAEVEIQIHLPNNISPDRTIDALYAFTQCENSLSPLGCVIVDNKPEFLGVSDILRSSTDHTLHLLKRELEITLDELEEQWHFASLERIFIENRIYREIEEEETWEGVISAIDEGLKPHITHLKRAVTEEDIVRLTEIRIKRISKFDIDKAQQKIDALEDEIARIKHHLDHLIDYAIDYFTKLKEKYGQDKDRKTELRLFEDIEASKVVIRNTKLYVNRKEGFIGTALKRDEYVTDCSDIDDIICFTADGKMMVTKVDTKTFIGKDIIHVAVFKKKDKRTIYNMIYRDGKGGTTYVKRFAVTSVTRDREYDLTQGKKDSKVLYFSANPNGEAEVITVFLRQVGSIKKLKFELDFSEILIKGRNVKGNIVTKYSVKRIELKEEGVSTLKPRKIWFDDVVKRLNVDERGELLGEFKGEDRLLIITQDGIAKTIKPELTKRFDEEMVILEKWNPKKPVSAIYWEPEKERYYVKRFLIEHPDKEEKFISDHDNAYLEVVSTDYFPMIEIEFTKLKGKDRRPNEEVSIEEFISVKGIKALGNQLTTDKVKTINLLDPLPDEPDPEEENEEKEEVDFNQIGTSFKEDSSEENQTKLFDDE